MSAQGHVLRSHHALVEEEEEEVMVVEEKKVEMEVEVGRPD